MVFSSAVFSTTSLRHNCDFRSSVKRPSLYCQNSQSSFLRFQDTFWGYNTVLVVILLIKLFGLIDNSFADLPKKVLDAASKP